MRTWQFVAAKQLWFLTTTAIATFGQYWLDTQLTQLFNYSTLFPTGPKLLPIAELPFARR